MPPRVISVQEIEAGLRRLRGVVATRVVIDPSGGVSEVHAVAEPGRPAKMLVRDIESTLLAQFNLAPGRNKISVAQLQPAQAETLKLGRPRLRLAAAEFTCADEQYTARVVLRAGDTNTEIVGTMSSPRKSDPMDAGESMSLLATATLRAVEGLAGQSGEPRLRLLDIAQISLAGQTLVAILVALRTDKGDDLLTGSALLRSDPYRAVVAATLDAVNRRLASLETRRP